MFEVLKKIKTNIKKTVTNNCHKKSLEKNQVRGVVTVPGLDTVDQRVMKAILKLLACNQWCV